MPVLPLAIPLFIFVTGDVLPHLLLELILLSVHQLVSDSLQILLVSNRLSQIQSGLEALLLDKLQLFGQLPQLAFLNCLLVAPIYEHNFHFLTLYYLSQQVLEIINAR